ncbi:MAG: hypothetical protein JNM69_20135 [Archangium sp.]|nr:hypothetical protein [Archangium sp.]
MVPAAFFRLPLIDGAFSLELEPSSGPGLALRYRGVERVREDWSAPETPRDVDTRIPLELPEHPRLEPVLDAWLDVMGEVFREQAARPEPSFPPRALQVWKPLKKLLAAETLDANGLREAWRLELAPYLPPPPALVAAHAALDGWFRALDGSTLASGEKDSLLASLEYVSNELREGAVWAVVRVVVWQRQDNGELMIRDVKEQEVVLLTAGPGLEPVSRVVNFFTAWREATSKLLERVDAEVLMPHDLVLTPQKYKAGQSVDDFRKLLWRKLKL